MNFKKFNRKNGFTLIELMMVIVIIGILVSLSVGQLNAAVERARYASLKNNMHLVQIAAETYSVSFGAIFPGTADQLKNHAKAPGNKYWKIFPNPFTKLTDPVNDIGDITSFDTAIAGNVYYAGHQSVLDSGYIGNTLYPLSPYKIDRSTYIIYSVDANHAFLTSNKKIFFMNNN